MTYEEVNRIFRTKFLGTCCIDLENDDGIYDCESPTMTCEKCRIAEAERMILDALEKQSNIVHCKDCQNWKIITIETIDGRTAEAGQCELTKWLCGEQGYCMYGREAE